jgi:hypothetical protein
VTGWRFFLVWMLTFLGFPVGGLLALLLVGSSNGAVDGVLGGAAAGVAIGVAQWLVLRGRLGMTPLWIAATALGLALGDGVGAALAGAGTIIGDLLVTGVVSGVAIGLLQGALLVRRVRAPGAWPLVVALAWPLGWTVTWAIGVDVERVYAVFGSTGALVFAAITGVGMLLILRSRDL